MITRLNVVITVKEIQYVLWIIGDYLSYYKVNLTVFVDSFVFVEITGEFV